MKIDIKKHSVRGVERWVVVKWNLSRRTRTFFNTEAEALAEAERLKAAPEPSQPPPQTVPGEPRLVLRFEDLPEDEQRRIVEKFAGRAAPKSGVPLIDEVIDELCKEMRAAGNADRYVDTLELLLGHFSRGREAQTIAGPTRADVQTFLDAISLASRPTYRARLSTLFNYAIQREYRLDNPCLGLRKVRRTKPLPQVFTPAEFSTLLTWCAADHKSNALHSPYFSYRHALAWLALSTACGLRPEEAEQIERRDINLDEGWIVVRPEISKLRSRRVVYPRPEAIHLLGQVIDCARLPLGSESKRRAIRVMRTALGWEAWPKDVTRHSAASYWLAVEPDSAQIALHLGNSEAILLRDYRALVTRKTAEAFWKIVGSWKLPKENKPNEKANAATRGPGRDLGRDQTAAGS